MKNNLKQDIENLERDIKLLKGRLENIEIAVTRIMLKVFPEVEVKGK